MTLPLKHPPSRAGDAATEPLQMIVDYGQAHLNPRETHHGVMEPIGLPANQKVAITLRFLKKRAGSAVTIGRLDGGEIDLQGPVTISSDGSVLFILCRRNARPLSAPGRRTRGYEISLYAIDPNRAPRPPNSSGH